MKISIVTAYYNRIEQFRNTLLSITNINDLEIIIIDDASDVAQKAEQVVSEFNEIDIKIINIQKEDKWYSNPCVPYNLGFKEASGEIIVIQNPECLHLGNILDYIRTNLQEDDYFSFSAYSLTKPVTDRVSSLRSSSDNYIGDVVKVIAPVISSCNKRVRKTGELGWYNHPVINPVGYHFLSAIHKHHIVEMGGFDEQYAKGIGYDDDEFLHRLRLKGLKIKIPYIPIVLHQNHYNCDWHRGMATDPKLLKNAALLESTKAKNTWKVNK